MTALKDLTGKRFGRLVVIKIEKVGKNGGIKWACKCICGNEVIVAGYRLTSRHTKSCGCLKKEVDAYGSITHGLSKNPLYSVWKNMTRRCVDKNSDWYHRYGGRGITICEEWKDLSVFVSWAESNGYKTGLEIDRIDNDGNYCPENCRFVTRSQNSHNKTSVRTDNTTGYTGVVINKQVNGRIPNNRFKAQIGVSIQGLTRLKHLGCFVSAEDAVIARDKYIIANNLPHKLQLLKR